MFTNGDAGTRWFPTEQNADHVDGLPREKRDCERRGTTLLRTSHLHPSKQSRSDLAVSIDFRRRTVTVGPLAARSRVGVLGPDKEEQALHQERVA